LLHALEYGLFTLLLYRAFRSTWKIKSSFQAGALIVGIAVILGALDELYQSFNPARTADPYDLMADAFGALSVAVFLLVRNRTGTLS
jgi:VanZ family protein